MGQLTYNCLESQVFQIPCIALNVNLLVQYRMYVSTELLHGALILRRKPFYHHFSGDYLLSINEQFEIRSSSYVLDFYVENVYIHYIYTGEAQCPVFTKFSF